MSETYKGALRGAPRSLKISYSVVAFFLLAANLRPALTSVGPVLEAVRSSLGLSGAAAGFLATLPLLIFAGCWPLVRLADVFGIERTLAGCLVLTTAGIALRSEGSTIALYGGTVVLAAGIGVANVLMPSIIKRDFPHRVGTMTTAYVTVMTLTGAVATGSAVPLAAVLPGGWKSALAIWSLFAMLALFLWLPEMRKAKISAAARQLNNRATATPIWRSALAWQITVFMGLQFLIYYVIIAWMTLYLADNGYRATEAGWLLTLYQVVAFGMGVAAPALLRHGRDQRTLAVTASSITALCVIGLLVTPNLAGLWLFVCGGSFGLTFILAFALIGMRTCDHRRAAALSTMAQTTAYLIAATGPTAFGWLHDLTMNWTGPMASLAAVSVIQSVIGFGVGRDGEA